MFALNEGRLWKNNPIKCIIFISVQTIKRQFIILDDRLLDSEEDDGI